MEIEAAFVLGDSAILQLERFDQAVDHYRAAEEPGSPAVLAALGQNLINQGRLAAGLACCNAALAIDAEHLDARLGRALANFLAGRYAAAWPDFRWRRRRRTWGSMNVAGREWEGQDLDGQRTGSAG